MAWAIIVAALTMIVVPAKADTHSLKIGVLAPLEGAFGPLGKDAVRGYELALSEHEGRAGERPIEAFVESTDGTPDSVIAKARMLIDRGASILIGSLAGIEGIAIREFAKGVPEVTFINGASAAQDATLRAPADNFFRFNPDSMQWIAGLGRYAYEEKDIRTIVSVAEDYSLPYTQLMGFMLDYCALGGQVLARHWISTGASDAARIAKTVSGTETDALFLALEPRAAKKFLEAYAEAGGQAAIVTGATTLSGSLLKASAIRPLLEGAISALPISESDDNEAWTEFTERYRERFPDAGPSPSLFALSYYVNTKALLLALDEIDGDLGDGHEGLREALAELSFDTPFGGPVELDANRQAVTSTFIVEVVEAAGGSLTQKTVHTVPDVEQTLGLPRDDFLALGPPSRANTLGSISESYASSCYGGGEAGPVIGAGGEADEVEPAQVVVQIAGGDAAAGTQEVLQPTVAAVHRLHMQIAPNPLPHRAVECFVAHPERGGARWVARAAVGDQQSVLRDHRIEGSRERRRIDPGQHRADRRPAPVCRHENRHLLAREAALLRLAAPAAVPCVQARAHPSGSPGRRSRPLPRSP